jgi:catalase
MLGHLMVIDDALGTAVEQALGMEGMADDITPAQDPIDMELSPTLSMIKKAEPILKGRKVAALVTDGVDDAVLDALRKAVEKEGAQLAIIAPKIGGVTTAKGKKLPADQALSGAPSVMFDAVAALPSEEGASLLVNEAAAIDWLRDAFGHLKVIGFVDAAAIMFAKAGIARGADEGVVDLEAGIAAFIKAAKQHRIWAREPELRTPG